MNFSPTYNIRYHRHAIASEWRSNNHTMALCCKNSVTLGNTGTSMIEKGDVGVNALTLVAPVLRTNGAVQVH
jgi:hypothetical protein